MSSTDQLSCDDANSVDGEGVWAPEIESAFHEGLKLFPPCGRRKHILQEEGGGKMYGRNELIARHILMRTGKIRTRKQVSSHIQVLNRRKQKIETHSTSASTSSDTPSPPSGLSLSLSGGSSLSSSTSNGLINNHHLNQHHHSLTHFNSNNNSAHNHNHNHHHHINNIQLQQNNGFYNFWNDGPIVTQKIRLVEFSAFNEHLHSLPAPSRINPPSYPPMLPTQFGASSNNSSRLTRHCYIKIDYSQSTGRQTNKLERIDINEIQDKFPDIGGPNGLFQKSPVDSFFLVKFWADINNDYEYNIDYQNSYFGFSSHFETLEPYRVITCSTKACSYGTQVVEKVDNIYGAFNTSNGRYSYDIDRTPMCEFMIQFIKKLRQLPEPSQMNSVLENFTVLQVITSESTSEILMCLAYVFEVASSEQNNGPQYHVYKLAKDLNLNCSK